MLGMALPAYLTVSETTMDLWRSHIYLYGQIVSSLMQNRMPLSLLHLGNGPWAVPRLTPAFV